MPTSDTNFSFISVWNHKVMVLNGKLFSCSFQKSPNFYFWHNSEWNNSLKSTLVFLGYNLYVSQLKHYPILLLLVIAHSYVGQIICPVPFFNCEKAVQQGLFWVCLCTKLKLSFKVSPANQSSV